EFASHPGGLRLTDQSPGMRGSCGSWICGGGGSVGSSNWGSPGTIGAGSGSSDGTEASATASSCAPVVGICVEVSAVVGGREVVRVSLRSVTVDCSSDTAGTVSGAVDASVVVVDRGSAAGCAGGVCISCCVAVGCGSRPE